MLPSGLRLAKPVCYCYHHAPVYGKSRIRTHDTFRYRSLARSRNRPSLPFFQLFRDIGIEPIMTGSKPVALTIWRTPIDAQMLLSTGRKVVSPTRLRATGSAERTWPRKPQEVGMRLLFPFREVRHCWWRSSHQAVD